ncbi:hypothetical protein FisN_17Hh173 [Fistulifera solaris]|uniref:START domain-containing protein n=1 Tax=Fistulifera solaris TaxID=1519565 RepID=A0A1Z5JHI8_FISSO|nr:hypothetical protein FisN_17Hh173 [Fistulifera solaris]|eukprot:GAX13238.1 hypothetical protein FisN_17Hh173 [Fistulifera solaris]
MLESSSSIRVSDDELMKKAKELIAVERYLEAARHLREVQDMTKLTTQFRHALLWADEMESRLKREREGAFVAHGWKKQGEAHANYDFVTYHKVDLNNRLTVRIELILESSMVVPLLAVLNETNLYSEWMPSWKHPRVGLRQSKMLHEFGRGNQIVQVTVDMPFPIATREVVQHAVSIDAIEEAAAILIRVKDLPPGYFDDDINIPEPAKGAVRIDFDAGIVIRACPEDHDLLKRSKRKYPENEHKVLVTIEKSIDAHVSYVPVSIINFFTRQVIKQMLVSLLDVARDIQTGKREKHAAAIQAKEELYGWVTKRVESLFAKFGSGSKD